MRQKIALFGEAEKGVFSEPKRITTLADLVHFFGNAPEESQGIPLAIQTLLYENEVVYFRVHEEGFSREDYVKGFGALEKSSVPKLDALCLPGVGDAMILEASSLFTEKYNALLLIQEQDLYDYLTELHQSR